MSRPEYFIRDKVGGVLPAYPIMAPEGVRPPYALYGRMNTNRERTMKAQALVPKCDFRVEIYATTYADVKDAADQIRVATDNFTGTWDGCEIMECYLTEEADGAAIEYEGETKPAYTVELTFAIRYREQ
jgi:hypothetical protein